jgi:hypothetical protein
MRKCPSSSHKPQQNPQEDHNRNKNESDENKDDDGARAMDRTLQTTAEAAASSSHCVGAVQVEYRSGCARGVLYCSQAAGNDDEDDDK